MATTTVQAMISLSLARISPRLRATVCGILLLPLVIFAPHVAAQEDGDSATQEATESRDETGKQGEKVSPKTTKHVFARNAKPGEQAFTGFEFEDRSLKSNQSFLDLMQQECT